MVSSISFRRFDNGLGVITDVFFMELANANNIWVN